MKQTNKQTEKLDMVAHICNCSIWKADTGRCRTPWSPLASQSSQLSAKFSKRPVFKDKVVIVDNTHCLLLVSMCTHATHTHSCAPPYIHEHTNLSYLMQIFNCSSFVPQGTMSGTTAGYYSRVMIIAS